MSRRDRLPLLALGAAALLWTLLATHASAAGLAAAAPALLLLGALVLGRYPGERGLARLRRRPAARRRTTAALPPALAARALRRLTPGGGALLAHHLAVRPPPALVARALHA